MNIFEILLLAFFVWIVLTKIVPFIRGTNTISQRGPVVRGGEEPNDSAPKSKERIDRSQVQDAEFKDVD